MSVTRVVLTQDVFSVCCNHALTTEREEIVGLLLGNWDIQYTAHGAVKEKNVRVWGTSIQIRSDRRKDRVEISPEQLSQAAVEAEALGDTMGTRTRVVGWYHSHPHTSVIPSKVDVRTQHEYQSMDDGFVGVIFSCFELNKADHSGQFNIIGFQSIEAGPSMLSRMEVPIKVMARTSLLPEKTRAKKSLQHCMANMLRLQQNMFIEEGLLYRNSTFSNFAELHKRAEDAVQDRKEEERDGAHLLCFAADNARVPLAIKHPMAAVYNSGIYVKSMSRLLECGCLPLLQVLEQQIGDQKSQIARLRAQNLDMRQKLLAEQSDSSESSDG